LLAIDLQVLDFSAPSAAMVGSGQQVQLSWTVQNNGTVAAEAGFWFDSVYLSDDDVFDPSDELLTFTLAGESGLAPGETYTFQEQVLIPSTAAGSRYLILTVDETNEVVEDDEANNFFASAIELSAPDVDLTVESFASPVSSVVAGQPFLLNWSIENTGSDHATAARTDRIYLSTDDFFDFGDEVIYEELRDDGVAPLTSILGSALLTIPNVYPPGTYYLFVGIDEFNDQFETNDFNNGTVLVINVVDTAPDLTVFSLDTDAIWMPGTTVDVTYTLSNTGSTAAEVPFYVGFYLSTDDIVSDDDVFLGADDAASELPLAVGNDFTRLYSINVPAGLSGDLHLLAVADFGYSVSELDESNNVLATELFVDAPAVLDLAVADLTAPLTVLLGSMVNVSYVVTNNGSSIVATPWVDRFFLSDDAILDEFDSQVDPQDYTFSLGLGVGESELVERSVTFQNASVGTGKYLLVQVGIGMSDDDTSNNVAAFQLDVVAPDLDVTAATAPSAASVNERVDVSWTVTNVGTAGIAGNWQDRFYLSADPVLSEFDTYLDNEFINHPTPIAPGGGYTINRSYSIPNFPAGTYYMFVRILVGGPQDANAANNVEALGAITISKPDLLVSQFDAPSIALVGDTISVTYTVLNDTDSPMGSTAITDRFVLSNDTVLGLDDDFLLLNFIGSDTLPLPAHGSYQRTVNLQLPAGSQGSKYLILRTNTFIDMQGELTYANNDFVHAIEIVAADLVVESVVAPASITFGTSFEVTYTVRNIGTGPTNQLSWFDRVALTSQDASVSVIVSDVLVTLDEPLAAGASYTRTIVANVPPIAEGGPYRIGVASDILNDQVEIDENNNVLLSELLPVTLPPVPDLIVTSVIAPVEGISGQQFALTWTVTNNGTAAAIAPWSDRVTLQGPQFMDFGLFAFVGSLAPGESVTRTEILDFPPVEGAYVVTIQSDFGNVVLEGPYEGNNTYTTTSIDVVVPPLPDLVISQIVAPADGVLSGSTVPISFTVTNIGQGATQSPIWSDFVFISTNPNFVYPDPLADDLPIITQQNPLITRPNLAYLEPGESYTQTVDVTIPLNAAGTWYVYVFPNGLGGFYSVPVSLLESDRTNNLTHSAGFQVNLTPAPDLVLSQAIAPLNVFSGQPANVQWTTTNNGPGATVATVWADQVYLSLDDELDQTDILLSTYTGQTNFTHVGRLEPGQSYVNSQALIIPNGLSGPYYFLVVTDAIGSVFEAGVDSNNVRPRLTNVNFTPPPDLVVDLVSVPTPSLAGHSIGVTYTVTNRGNTDTPTAHSLDRIYLSTDGVLDGDDLLLTEVWAFTGVLAVDESYTRTRSVTLPADIEGEYFIFVSANANDTLFEIDRANNVLSSAAVEVVSMPPNLVVSQVSGSAIVTAGQVATVSWTVQNTGVGDSAATHWIDKVYLSTNGTTSGGILLGYFVRNGVLAPGESYTRTGGVTVPFEIEGGAWFYVVTDAVVSNLEASLQLPPTGPGGNVYEAAAEGDNTSTLTPVTVVRNTPDLDITALSISPSLESGAAVEISWTVTNLGGLTNSDHWTDDVYLSLDGNLSAEDILLGSVFHSGALGQLGAYTASLTVALPSALTAGNYYFIVQTDRTIPRALFDTLVNRVYEGFSEANNIEAILASVALAAVPDLVVNEVESAATTLAGRSLEVTWTVANNGAATGDKTWRDAIYLSADQFLDPTTDRFLGFRNHTGGLGAGEQYTTNGSFAIPGGLTGPYYVFVRTDVGEAIYERQGEGNNTGYDPSSVQLLLGQPVDFTVGWIDVPASATVGVMATIGYTITNNVNLPVPGGWTDSIYLSADEVWDAGDVLFAQVPHPGDLAAGESYSQLVTRALPILAPGNYRVIIRTDVFNNVVETNNTNNLGVSLDVAAVDAVELELEVPQANGLSAGGFLLYRVDVAAGQTLRFSWDSAFNNAATGMYVRYGQPPTRNVFDLQSTLHFQADHEIFVPSSKAGTYYVLVHASAGNASGTVLVESLPFSVVAASPGQVGNAGNATIEITGALFTRGTTFELHLLNGPIIEAQAIYVESAARAYATFDLRGVALGEYDLVARATNGAVATIASAVDVVESLMGGQLTMGVNVPDFTLTGAQGIFFITYSNTGNNDIVAPLLTVRSETGTLFGREEPELQLGEDAVIYGALGSGPAGILRPGEMITIPFKFIASEVLSVAYTFELLYFDGDDATPIDWSYVEEHLPTSVRSSTQFAAIFAQLQSTIGSTMGDYVRFLSRMANLLPPELGEPTDQFELLDLAAKIAAAAVSPSISGRLDTDRLDIDLSGYKLLAQDDETGQSAFAFTLNDGSFYFPNMEPGTYRFSYEQALISPTFEVELLPTEQHDGVVIPVEKGGTIFGTARSTAGDIISDGGLFLYDPDAERGYSASIGTDGRYSFAGLPEGSYTLEIEAPGFASSIEGPMVIAGDQSVQRDIVLTEGSSISANVALSGGGTLTSAITLRAIPAEMPAPATSYSVRQFSHELQLAGLAAGEYEVTISLDGYLMQTFDVTLGDVEAFDLGNIILIPAARISGVVSFLDSFRPVEPAIHLLLAGEVVDITVADPTTGGFEFRDVAPGSYEVRVENPLAYGTSQFVEIEAGEQLSGVQLSTLKGGAITGVVTDAMSGLPIAGATVLIYGDTGGFGQTTTDVDGRYRFNRLGLANYTVSVAATGANSSATLAVTDLDEQELEANLSIESVARIEGQLALAGGAPVTVGSVSLLRGDDLVAITDVNESGGFQFLLLEPGLYTLQAASPQGSFAAQSIQIDEGDTEEILLEAGTLSVTVNLSGASVALANAEVSLVRVEAYGTRQAGYALADSGGSVEFDHLAPGTYWVLARTSDSFGGLTTIVLGGPLAPQQLVVQPLSSVSGIVRDSLGDPIQGAYITLTDPATGIVLGKIATDADGEYELTGLFAGTYDMVIRRSNFLAEVQTGVVVTGDVALGDVLLTTSTALITGQVVDSSGRGVPDAVVRALNAAGQVIGQAVANADGLFTISTAAGADLTIVVSANGYETVVLEDVSVAQGQTVDLGTPAIDALAVAIDAEAAVSGSFTATSETSNTSTTEPQIAFMAMSGKETTGEGGTFSTADAPLGPPILDDQALDQILKNLNSMDDIDLAPLYPKRDPELFPKLDERKVKYDALEELNRLLDPGTQPDCGCEKEYQEYVDALKEQERLAKIYGEANQILTLLRITSYATLVAEFDSQIIVPFVIPFARIQGILAGSVAVGQVFVSAINTWSDAASAVTAKEWDTKATFGFAALFDAGSFGLTILEGIDKFFSNAPEKLIPLASKWFGLLANTFSGLANLAAGNFMAKTKEAFQRLDEAEEKVKKIYKQFDASIRATYDAWERLVDCIERGNCDDKGNGGGGPWGKRTGLSGSRLDPNDILGPDGYGDPRFVAGSSSLDYTVRFENLELATLPVQNLVITTQLDSDLDFRTVRFGSFGWGDVQVDFDSEKPFLNERVDLTATLGFYVDAVATIDVETGLATWTLTAIDPATGLEPLDDRIGFLPPNDDSHIGEGFVTYSARPKAGLTTGTVIDAQATIIFDTEPPLDTPVWSNTLDVDAPSSQLDVLPVASTEPNFLLSWTANDVAGGSGLATTTIFVSENGGAFRTLFIAGGALQQYLFEGTLGNSYRFFSVAADNAGNREAVPTVADALTTLLVNSPPTVVTPIADIEEDEDAADTVLDLSDVFGDIDVGAYGDSLTFEIVGNTNSGLVNTTLDGTTLTLDYAANQHGTATIIVRATDLAGEWVEDTFLVTIDSVNDAPTVATPIANVIVDEDAPNTIIDVTSNFADVDIATDADSLTYSVTGNTNADLVIGSFDGSNLTLDYTANQHGTATITVRATDESGEWIETSFLVTVDSVNDEPTVATPIANVNVDEDAPTTIFDIFHNFTDVDTASDGDSLTYTVTGNTNAGLITATLDGSSLMIDSVHQQHGISTITIRATDESGAWVEASFLVTVNPVNDDPTVAAPIANVTVDEDAPNTVIDISGTFADVDIATDGDSLTYSVTGNTNTGLVTTSFDGSNLTLDYTANQHGTATITVRATDESGEWIESSFLVTVTAVNDDPTVATPLANISVDEDAPNTVINVSSNFADVDITTDADSLTYTVTGNTNAGLVATSFDGTNLTLDYAPNQHGTATITVRATDESGEWVETSFLVTVAAVNDDPTVATPLANISVDEDAPNTVINVASNFADVDIATDADSLTYTVTGNTNTGLVTTSFDGTNLTLDYAANQHGTATITVRATDELGEWVETSFLVTVTAVGVELPFSDDFNRSNGTSLGDNWIETLGDVGIASQHVVMLQNTESTAILADLSVADVSIRADVDLTGAEVGRSVALMARSQGPGDANAYWGIYYRSDSGYAAQIYKNIGGVPTPLRSVNVPGPAGNLRFEVFGTTLNLFFNEMLVTSVIDDALLGAGAVGLRKTGGTLDNFAATISVPPLSESAFLPFSDSFDRPDNSLFGSVWTERSGDTGIRNNAAGLYANDTSVVTLNGVHETDVSVSADIDITGVSAQFSSGLLARYSGPGDANTYMARLFRSDSGNYAAQIWKSVGGQYTPLRSVFVSSGAGNLRFEVVGDQLQLFFNNSLVASTIDTSISGPGQVGMRLAGGTLDNFVAAEATLVPQSDAELPFFDNFSRSDSSSLGEFWSERAGDLGLLNEHLVLVAGETSVATLNGISAADVDVSADIDITSGGNAGLLARYSGPGDFNAYLGLLQPVAGGTFAAQIWRNTGTDWQNLTHSSIDSGLGELRFVVEGSQLQLFFDGLLVGDIQDSSITAPGTVGVRQSGGTIDNFAAALAETSTDDFIADGLFASDDDWTLDSLVEDLLQEV